MERITRQTWATIYQLLDTHPMVVVHMLADIANTGHPTDVGHARTLLAKLATS